MRKDLVWKVALIVGLMLACVFSIFDNGIKLGLDLKGGFSFLLKMDLAEIDSDNQPAARQQAVEILRKRIDGLGVKEPIIQPVGEDRILVQIPGLEQEDRKQLRNTIERTAFLEFRLVHAQNEDVLSREVSDPAFRPPVGYEKLTIEDTQDGKPVKYSYYVKKRAEMTGTHLKRAFPQFDELSRPHVALEFDSKGADAFGRITSANVGRLLAIVLDGELYSAPVIEGAIMGGRAQITGSFTLPEAQELANVLENPLEAPVQIVEERGVDPTLGRDSIRSGVMAAAIGAALVILFMAIYYRGAGLVSIFAIGLNMLLLVGALAGFDFTLTLPGLAGVVLTVGMAVDASVLIYERIREERDAHKGFKAAVTAGFQRAFIVIFDSNFTTIVTAIILIWMGSGPVKGFGVTLTIGLLANLFAVVFVTRLIFEWLIDKGWMKSMSMLQIIGKTSINFLGVRAIAFAASWLLIAIGLFSFAQRGGLDVGKGAVYGIDFSGGDTVMLEFEEKVDSVALRHSLEGAGLTDALIQYQRDLGSGSEVLSLKLPEGEGETAVGQLEADHPSAGFRVIQTERVGAVIGSELLREGLMAVFVAAIAIALYVAFRFGEFAYGLGAVVALTHDVLMCIGIFCLAGRTFSLPVVAALLTVLGYSVNDTIIVFDRVRENLKLHTGGGKIHYFDLINRSINQTLPRTLLTAGTTFLTAVTLFVFGGRVINDFAFMFMIGVATGTFSSIYIASPIVLWAHRGEAPKPRESGRKPEPVRA